MEEPGSTPQPERKGRYTLPGGRPAFAPGWDQGIDVSEPETEAADVAGDKVAVRVTVDGRVAVEAPDCLSLIERRGEPPVASADAHS